jgi:hypothetical protein
VGGLLTVISLIVVGTWIWVGVDASKRDWSEIGYGTVGWLIGCFLLWIVFFPLYLVRRKKAPLKGASIVAGPAGVSSHAEMYRECPHCKEAMRRDADTCPHCRRTSTPWRFYEGRWWFRENAEAAWQWLDEKTGSWVTPSVSPLAAT